MRWTHDFAVAEHSHGDTFAGRPFQLTLSRAATICDPRWTVNSITPVAAKKR